MTVAGTETGAAITGSFSGAYGSMTDAGPSRTYTYSDGEADPSASGLGLAINEVASKGDPLDWFELYNYTNQHISLANFFVSDDLTDVDKRVAFPTNLLTAPGEYLQVEVDTDNWAGFKLGGDEELGLWTSKGALVDSVNWDEGDSGEGESYARVPDGSGEFQTVGNPTPGAANPDGG